MQIGMILPIILHAETVQSRIFVVNYFFLQKGAECGIQYFTTNLFEQQSLLGLVDHPFGNLFVQISTPERAILEVLYLVPHSQSIEEAWLLMEGLVSLRPRLIQSLLMACNSIKVRRLFLYLAEQQQHSWFQRLDIDSLDLGSGNRSISPGGRLDPRYLITVPNGLGLN
jgi:Transcriptional regulator, AbiEi antitoxin, Type IV TA system